MLETRKIIIIVYTQPFHTNEPSEHLSETVSLCTHPSLQIPLIMLYYTVHTNDPRVYWKQSLYLLTHSRQTPLVRSHWVWCCTLFTPTTRGSIENSLCTYVLTTLLRPHLLYTVHTTSWNKKIEHNNCHFQWLQFAALEIVHL